MTPNMFRYLLFPHTTITEKDYRHLAILLPHLSVLQVIRPLLVPPWGQEQFRGWPVLEEEGLIEQVKLFLKGFQEFATVHGENSMMASLSHEWIAREAVESRFRIQGALKEKKAEASESRRNLLLEAAVFLEMARDLDEHEAELEGNLVEVDGLEEEFREILGITDEEEIDEAISALTPSLLDAERSGLSFMLPKRISCWLRLFLNQLPPDSLSPVLVSLSPEVMEEVLDPVVAERDRSGTPLEFIQTTPGTFPSLERLTSEEFQDLLHQLLTSGHLPDYRLRLADFLGAPTDNALREALTLSSTSLQNAMEDFCRSTGKTSGKQVSLTITALEACTFGDFGKCLDKEGSQVWGNAPIRRHSPSLLLNLGSSHGDVKR